jgi:predicted nucleotidyltransferase
MGAIPSPTLPIPYDAIIRFCEKHRLRRFALFGSVLRNDFSPHSDVDILVEFDPNAVPGWEFYGDWVTELSTLFGRPVDIGTFDSLRPWLKQRIQDEMLVIYERIE